MMARDIRDSQEGKIPVEQAERRVNSNRAEKEAIEAELKSLMNEQSELRKAGGNL